MTCIDARHTPVRTQYRCQHTGVFEPYLDDAQARVMSHCVATLRRSLTATVGDAGAGVKLSDFRRHPRLSADTINALEPRKERRMNSEGTGTTTLNLICATNMCIKCHTDRHQMPGRHSTVHRRSPCTARSQHTAYEAWRPCVTE